MPSSNNLSQYFAVLLFVNYCFWSCEGVLHQRTGGVNDRSSPDSRQLGKHLELTDSAAEDSVILVDNLEDGEMERRILFNGLFGKETSIQHNDGRSLILLQLSNGRGFLQLIYENLNELIDCEYTRTKHVIDDFKTKFYQEINVAKSRNFTSLPYTPRHKSLISNHEFRRYIEDNIIPDEYNELQEMMPADDAFGMRNIGYKKIEKIQDIPIDIRRWLNFHDLKAKCTERHRQIKSIIQRMKSKDHITRENATEHFNRKKRALSDWLIAPNTKWCGRGHNASKYSHLGGASRTDKCCRKHDHCGLFIPGLTTKWELFNFRPFTLSHCKCDMRQRRDLQNLLRVPGTKWCGRGWSATKYADLGGFSKADRCCRQHDKSCPVWIMGFETKYGLFNWRVNTLMHCKCDERTCYFRRNRRYRERLTPPLECTDFSNEAKMARNILSPIDSQYENSMNSAGIPRGFISSTPIDSRNMSRSPSPSVINRRKIFTTLQPYRKEDYEDVENQPAEDIAKQNQNLLKQILQNQNTILRRLAVVENYIQNESINRNEFSAQSKQVRETLVVAKQSLKATKHLVGDNVDEYGIEIASAFPMTSVAEVSDMEERMQDGEFADSMRIYLQKMKGSSTTPEFLFRKIISDKCVQHFNWDGRCGKRALRAVQIFDKTMFDIFPALGRQEFESLMRKYIEKSHNRFKQQKRKLAELN